MSNKKLLVFIFCLFAVYQSYTQNCNYTLEGFVFDETSGLPLSFVNVVVQETSAGTTTDDYGNFTLEDICYGEYHLIFSHIGCEPVKIHVDIEGDTILDIGLHHTSISLGNVVVEGQRSNQIYQANLSINRQSIEDNSNRGFSSLLENETGVYTIKNGSGISKPVVHGLYGNRLTILNNGIIQSGQQWGNDHSPEIDPYSADKITVIKGANAIEYGGGNLGSVILVEPKRISRDEPHLHGQVNYVLESNGWGNSLNARLGKYSPILAWKINGSLKKYGDKKAVDYYLNNTGIEEMNFSVQLEKVWEEKLFFDFYASTFNTNIGVLRGSHIGSLTDLEFALERDVPYFTEPNFSYTIEAPKQDVSHHLAKLKAKYLLGEDQVLEFVLAGQLNNRKEFDVRRSGRTDIPSLSLQQYTTNIDLKYSKEFNGGWKLKLGQQNIFTNNTNNPETGILPLIPDYLSWRSGLFSSVSKNINALHFNLGIRYDYEYQDVVTISNTAPREIIRYNNNFHNTNGILAIKYDINKSQIISFNSGFAMRNPGINELYSNGLHQGVSGIEEGDVNLKTEKSFKNTLEYKWLPNTNFSFSALAYHQHFNDYIFLNPQDEIRLTIRGAFPVFKYEQTDANIYGFDISSQFTIGNFILGQIKYSYLKGDDIKNNTPLIFMPPNRFYGNLTYRVSKPIKISEKVLMEDLEIELNNRYIFEQKHINSDQDFTPPPPSYNLTGLKVSTNFISPHHKFRCFIKADNLFNVKYRDYLNRQRYFADDLGISLSLGLSFKF